MTNIASNQKQKEAIEHNKNNNPIYNMILLHTGYFALSIKEAIEIYDFRKLNLDRTYTITYNNNQIKYNNCLLQRINLLKSQKIYNVFEFPDKTLFCGSNSKISYIPLKKIFL